MATFEQLPSGSWLAKIRRRGYKTQTRAFHFRADAEAWALSVESLMVRGTYIDLSEARRTTLREALERYSREVTAKKRGRRQEQLRIAFWLRQPLVGKRLTEVRASDLAAHRDARLAEGKAPQTVINELNLIGHLFEVARKEWGMTGLPNPAKDVRKPTRSQGRDRRLEGDEEKRLLEHASPELQLFIQIALETGVRRAELYQRTWKDVDLKKRVLALSDTKNGSSRGVPLSPKAVAAFRKLEKLSSQEDGRLWSWPHIDSITHAFTDACKEAGIEGLRLHDLRHEATSRLVESGLFNMVEVASITGHKTMVMLKRYSHPRAEELAARLKKRK